MKWSALWVSLLLLGSGLAVAEVEPDERDDERSAVGEPLARNVMLVFEMLPLDEGDQGSFVMTASPHFETSTRYLNDDFELLFDVSGRVELRDDARIFLTYEVAVEFEGDGEEAEFEVASSVLLRPGKATPVARMGDKILTVTASYEADDRSESLPPRG